jgi:thymidylate kinase
MSKIFILTGVPGSGKSSVACALLQHFPTGLHLPVDEQRAFVVSGIAHPIPEWTDETSRQFRLARQATLQTARRDAREGFTVAIDDVISLQEAQSLYEPRLAREEVYKILLQPDLETALERNRSRQNKNFDTEVLAETIRRTHQSFAEEGNFAPGWLVIDTSQLSVEQTVARILESFGL